MIDPNKARLHPSWNPDTLRIELSDEEFAALPFKDVTPQESRELMTHWDFNPNACYRPSWNIAEREIGQDTKSRYLIGANGKAA